MKINSSSDLLRLALIFAIGWLSSCRSANVTNPIAEQSRKIGGRQISQAENLTHFNSIDDIGQFNSLGLVSQGLIKNGKLVKFLIDLRGESPETYFLNANFTQRSRAPDYVRYHYYFAEQNLNYRGGAGQFNKSTYFATSLAERKFIAGSVQTFELDGTPTLSIHFYPQDSIKEEVLALALKEVLNRIHLDQLPKVFIQLGSHQSHATIGAEMAKLNIRPITLSEATNGQKMVIMNPGKAIGFLRISPQDVNALSEMDIPVFTELPLDLSVVAGTLTVAPQDIGSHINLKLQERNTPNVVDLEALEKWRDFDGKAVELVVTSGSSTTEGNYTIRRLGADSKGVDTGAAMVTDHYLQVRKNKKWYKLPALLSGTEIKSFEDMCPGLPSVCLEIMSTFGGKAAKLGFLANKTVLGMGGDKQNSLGYRLNPLGFGIPMEVYFKLLEMPENKNLKMAIKDMIDSEMGFKPLLASLEKAAALAKIQEGFYAAQLPGSELTKIKGALATLVAAVKAENGNQVQVEKVKIRSSSNAEDLPDFDGAGLHNSYSANVSKTAKAGQVCHLEYEVDGPSTKAKMKPATLECALLGVYASLWNKRAVEERSFAGIDHNSVGMGIAVVPTYNYLKQIGITETANGVGITRVLSAPNVYGYTYTIQDGENLATNPDPETQSEITLANFLTPSDPLTYSILNYATPVKGQPPLTQKVLSDAVMNKLVDLSQHIERRYCESKEDYYQRSCRDVVWDTEKPKALDLEFKILGPKKEMIMIKQIREFSGGSASDD